MGHSAVREALYGATQAVTYQGERPILSVVIDTEEEFDWSRPHARDETSTAALRDIGRAQAIFDRYGVRPCYVIDYPVAVNQEDHRQLREIHQDGRCVIGTHLHPWVTPPHEEAVNAFNSFPGNLPRALEYAKLKAVTEAIADNFGHRSVAYKAGRYGVGPNTRDILRELGYQVELSPTPGFDYSGEGGPDFSRYSNEPFWFGAQGDNLCLPCTGGFAGLLASFPGLYRLATQAVFERLHAPGILARLGLIERIRLSPEGFTLAEMKRITLHLLARGTRFFTLSFHSPSVAVGQTPYVKDEKQLQAFLATIGEYLEFFRSEIKGDFQDPVRVRALLKG